MVPNPSVLTASPMRESVRLPLLDEGVLLRVQVEVFGEPLFLIVDTGAAASALDRRFQQRLQALPRRALVGTPIHSASSVPCFQGPTINVRDREWPLGPVVCSDCRWARWITGEPCDGILGMPFLREHVVEFDFGQGSLTLSPHRPDFPAAESLTLECRADGRFGVDAVLQGSPLSVTVDTGCTSSLVLGTADWNRLFPQATGEVTATQASLGASVVRTRSRRVESLVVGDQAYRGLIACEAPNPGLRPLLGLGFLRNHRVRLDFPGRRLFLERVSSAPESADMSGLHLLRVEGRTRIHSVDPDSPAVELGLREGDALVAIDGGVDRSMREIRSLLAAGEGRRVRLLFQRQGQTAEREMTLRRLI